METALYDSIIEIQKLIKKSPNKSSFKSPVKQKHISDLHYIIYDTNVIFTFPSVSVEDNGPNLIIPIDTKADVGDNEVPNMTIPINAEDSDDLVEEDEDDGMPNLE